MLPQILITLSAVIALLSGLLHLKDTFSGSDLRPRDPELEARMKEVSLGVSTQATMWNTWLAFNASQSMGLILFGLLYGYFAMFQSQLLFRNLFLLVVGALYLAGFTLLAQRYMFSLPFILFLVASVLYVVGAVIPVI
jgi:hypothetical protein